MNQNLEKRLKTYAYNTLEVAAFTTAAMGVALFFGYAQERHQQRLKDDEQNRYPKFQ